MDEHNTLKCQNVYNSNAFKKCKKWCHNLTYIVVICIQIYLGYRPIIFQGSESDECRCNISIIVDFLCNI